MNENSIQLHLIPPVNLIWIKCLNRHITFNENICYAPFMLVVGYMLHVIPIWKKICPRHAHTKEHLIILKLYCISVNSAIKTYLSLFNQGNCGIVTILSQNANILSQNANMIGYQHTTYLIIVTHIIIFHTLPWHNYCTL